MLDWSYHGFASAARLGRVEELRDEADRRRLVRSVMRARRPRARPDFGSIEPGHRFRLVADPWQLHNQH